MRLVQQAHEQLEKVLTSGDICIDATAGNGYDTLFLAKTTQPNGIIYSIDIQKSAIHATKERIKKYGLIKQLKVFHATHEDIGRLVDPDAKGNVAAVMFNLGYLPGGDPKIITRTKGTVKSIEEAYRLLKPNGVISILCYRGHEGGEDETQEVINLSKSNKWKVKLYYGNEKPSSPILLIIQKL